MLYYILWNCIFVKTESFTVDSNLERWYSMGKAIYVFEVQSKGWIDSLILNLKKAQSNAAVQAVVAVADEEQLAKIISESAGVIDEKSLRTWDSEDVLAVYDSLVWVRLSRGILDHSCYLGYFCKESFCPSLICRFIQG